MKIKKNHLKKENKFGDLLFKDREAKTEIDTIILHSIYLDKNILNPKKIKSTNRNNREKISELFAILNTKEVLEEQRNEILNEIYNFIGLELKSKFNEINIKSSFSSKGIELLFEYLGISAHYVINRKGEIIELVNPKNIAFHAGKSILPNTKKEAVNDFSIGIELLASSSKKVNNKQYKALNFLTNKLLNKYPIKNILGHKDIAIPKGRKIDPEGFSWKKFINVCEIYKKKEKANIVSLLDNLNLI